MVKQDWNQPVSGSGRCFGGTPPISAVAFPLPERLEHFQKNCNHAVGGSEGAVFGSFDFVLAQLQGLANLRLRQRPMIGTTRH
jgi:hypothetical protein